MNKLLAGFALCAFLISAPQAQADDMDRLVQSLCEYTKANDRTNLRKKLKATDMQLRRVYGGMVCGAEGSFNGGTLLRVAITFGATDAAEFIVSQVGADTVKAPEHDGKSVLQWGEEQSSDPVKKAVVDIIRAAG